MEWNMTGKSIMGKRRRNSGFTLLEGLIVVAVLVILLGLGMAGVARYRNYLKITELDNIARDIYMAAQNRAVLLHNSGRLQTELDSTTTPGGADLPDDLPDNVKDITEGTTYITWSGTTTGQWSELLPQGTIDPSLRNGRFHIVYEPGSGSVTDVFYSEANDLDFAGIVDAFTLAKEGRDARMKAKVGDNKYAMLGWFGGDAAKLAASDDVMSAPRVLVKIVNGDELTLTVEYTLPDDLPTDPSAGVSCTPYVRLEYGGKIITLLDPLSTHTDQKAASGRGLINPATDSDSFGTPTRGATVTYTCVLDSLEDAKQFKNLVSGGLTNLGGDFKIVAGLKMAATGYIEQSYFAEGVDNSLFDTGSTYDDGTAGTAQIANLRHLQNLHPAHSKVGTGGSNGYVANAVQTADIDCTMARHNDGTAITGLDPYDFTPIENSTLTSYKGQGKHIYNLSASAPSGKDAGLFGTVDHNLTIDNCRVCWTDPDRLVNTTDPDNKVYVYAVQGKNAGGLIGSVTGGNVTITNSFAATTAKGTGDAGGLVGYVKDGATLTVTGSYADCYLSAGAGTGTNAGGLVGSNAGTVTLENCYAAGFITGGATSAGLVNNSGSGSVIVTDGKVYSVVRVLNDGMLEEPAVRLYGDKSGEDENERYFPTTDDVPDDWFFGAAAVEPDTTPYDLRHKLDSSVEELPTPYPYPGLDGLPHYGDWADVGGEPAGLVYYEIYSDDSCGVEGWYEDQKINTLQQDVQPVKDGYALIFEQWKEPAEYNISYTTDTTNLEDFTVNADNVENLLDVKVVGTQTWALSRNGPTWKWTGTVEATIEKDTGATENQNLEQDGVSSFSVTQDSKTYTFIPLPDELVTGDVPYCSYMLSNNPHLHRTLGYYQKLSCDKGTRTYWFNPHFAGTEDRGAVVAGTVVIGEEGKVISYTAPDKPANLANAASSAVIIRTPRHLYDLSKPAVRIGKATAAVTGKNSFYYSRYSNSMRQDTTKWYFLQKLDLDYNTYNWYGRKPTSSGGCYIQLPIGNKDMADTAGAYNGTYAAFKGTYDGGGHIIRNVFVDISIGHEAYGLFGYIGCDNLGSAWLKNIVYEMNPEAARRITEGDGSRDCVDSVGALVGESGGGGIIENCAVYGVCLQTNSAQTGTWPTGGLVGINGGTIERCSVEVVSLTAVKGDAGGLVGNNQGSISNSYAVGKVTVSDSSRAAGGLAASNAGTIADCYAAVELVNDGAKKYGCYPGSGGSCYWLKDGFHYRGGDLYLTAGYTGAGSAITASELMAKVADGGAWSGTGWSTATGIGGRTVVYDIPDTYSWKAAYEGKSFPYLTAVKGLNRGPTGNIITSTGGLDKSTHYGLWPVEPAAGLAYYEQYKDEEVRGVQGLSAGGAALSSLKNDAEILKDGYALVFDGEAVPTVHTITYGTRKWMLRNNGTSVTWTELDSEGNAVGASEPAEVFKVTKDGSKYSCATLPNALVMGDVADTGSFYQKLECTTDTDSSKSYWFNQHFAKTVRTGVSKPADPTVTAAEAAGSAADYAYVRTPRHFYDLSQFQTAYVGKSLYYKQELDLNYNTYTTGYDGFFKPAAAGHFGQTPIGTADATPFTGTYDGGGKTISGVRFSQSDSTARGGLFGVSTGTLKDIHYAMGTEELAVVAEDNAYVGMLVGYNNNGGTVYGCTVYGGMDSEGAVTGINLSNSVKSARVGGLIGYNKSTVSNNCAVTVASLTNSGLYAGVGGLIGFNEDFALEGFHITVTTLTNSGEEAYVGGLVGRCERTDLTGCSAEVTALTNSGESAYVGGLVGRCELTDLTGCSAEVTALTNRGKNARVGGLAGYVSGRYKVTNCMSTVTTLTNTNTGTEAKVGGLIGDSTDVFYCRATVNELTNRGSSAYVGGLIGDKRNGSYLNHSDATVGKLTNSGSSAQVGGLAGAASAHVEDCTATITGDLTNSGSGAYVGGLAGKREYGRNGHDKRCAVIIEGSLTNSGSSACVGGLAGSSTPSGSYDYLTIQDVTNITIEGNLTNSGKSAQVGGLIGGNVKELLGTEAAIITVTIKGNLTNSGQSASVGGLMGQNARPINTNNVSTNPENACAITVAIEGGLFNEGKEANVGGLIGGNINRNNTTNSKLQFTNKPPVVKVTTVTNSGESANVGGLVGSNVGTLENASGTDVTPTLNTVTNSGKSANVGGLIGNSNAAISGLTITVPNLTNSGEGANVGGLVGYSKSPITSCTATVTTLTSSAGSFVGGLVGKNESDITGVKGTTTVTVTTLENTGSGTQIGGLAGHTEVGIIKDCSVICVDMLSSGSHAMGGLVGYVLEGETGEIRGCEATVDRITHDYDQNVAQVGGLVGNNKRPIINCYAIIKEELLIVKCGDIPADQPDFGGLVGRNFGTIENCWARVEKLTYNGEKGRGVGGLVGRNYSGGSITDCHAEVVTLTNTGSNIKIGGLVGHNYKGATIKGTSAGSCYATVGTLINSGTTVRVGGLVGQNDSHTDGDALSKIENCTATVGTLTNTGTNVYAGGLVGFNSSQYSNMRSEITNCTATVGTLTNTGTNVYAGGLVGRNSNNSIIKGCSATVGTLNDGGSASLVKEFVGNNQGTITP